ncbi:MAG TPA: TnsA endonuclease N-terminal domain-containing protein [Opitutaceae bacterium]
MKRHRFTNSTGTVAVRGTNSGGKYKSKLEREGFIKAYLGADVVSVHLQQPGITYTDGSGKPRRYTGDLLVRFNEKSKRRPLVIECKYAQALADDPSLVEKHKRVALAFNEKGHDFSVQTEREIRTPDFRMMKFVFDHRNNDPHPANHEIMTCMRTHKSLSLEVLIKAVRSNLIEQYALIPEVWRLVALGELKVDFHQNLDLAAKITL